jgi:hypothetical protein
LKDVHWDPVVSGESWDQTRHQFRPKITETANVAEVRVVLGEMLATLNQFHCVIIPADEARALEAQAMRGGQGVSGLTARYIDESIVVTKVAAGSHGEH